MLNDDKLVKLIAIGPIIFIPSIIVIIILFIIKTHNDNFNSTLLEVKSSLIQTERAAVKAKIDSIVDLVEYQNSIIVENLKKRVKDRVDSAYKISESIYNQYKDKKSPQEIQNIIKTTLRPLLWNDGESFIWILDYKGVFYLAPEYLRHKEGTSIIDFQDATGRYVIHEEIKLCQTKGNGFLWDTFTKPGEDPNRQYKQVAYVKAFLDYDWYLGSGEYLDTAYKISNGELLESINKISALSSDYVYVLSNDGKMLLNSSVTPDQIGVLIDHGANRQTKKALKVHQDALEHKKSAFMSYEWLNPTTQEQESKYSYARRVNNSNWIIGSGFYESRINSKASYQAKLLHDAYDMRIQNLIFLGALLVIISFIFSYFISRYVSNSFHKYRVNIHEKNRELEELNLSLEDKVKKRTQQLEESKASLELLATTDSLTKVHNRFSIMKLLEKEMERSNRHDIPLTLFMYDHDHFKEINDKHGHDVGDVVLQEVSKEVKNNLREIDSIGRYGGEEFIVIMPQTSLEEGKISAERIRESIAQCKCHGIDNITISIGLCQYRSGESLNKLFKRLDTLLYESKQHGRNRTSY